jgi:outer membrane protein TolC
MRDRHEPDPRFVESLEGELSRRLRRNQRTGIGPRPAVRFLKTGSLIAGSLVLGAAAMGFSQQLSDAWRRELLEARLEVQLEVAQQRVALQLETLGLTREQVEQGVRSDRDLMYFELQIAEAEAAAKTTELALEELRRSGREPLGELSSPLVDGRDFVSERIQVRMEIARHHLDVVRHDEERARQRVEAGLISDNEVQARNLVALQAELQLESLAKQLELRRAYLDSEITAVEAELKLIEVQTQNQVVLLNARRDHFQRELEHMEEAVGLGSMHPAAAAQLRTGVAEVEGALRLAQAELEIVQRELERRSVNR